MICAASEVCQLVRDKVKVGIMVKYKVTMSVCCVREKETISVLRFQSPYWQRACELEAGVPPDLTI